jgi:hypothetical protein
LAWGVIRTEVASTLPVEASDPVDSTTATQEPVCTSARVPVDVRVKTVLAL